MHISIQIDTREGLTNEDKAVLRALFLDEPKTAAPAKDASPTKTAEPEKPAAAPKKTAKKAVAPTPDPAEDLTPEDSPVVKDAPEESADEDARDAAVARASELLSGGQRDRVMAALKAAGAARVSEVPADKIGEFLNALSDD